MIKFECINDETIFKAEGDTEKIVAQSIAFVLQLSDFINEREKNIESQEAFKKLFIILAEKILSNGVQEIVDLLMEMAKKEAENEQ